MERFLTHVVKFVNGLHRAGLKVSPSELIDLCRALRIVDIGNRAEFRAAAAATLVRTQADLDRFDKLFRSYWDGEMATATEIEPARHDAAEFPTGPGGEPDSIERMMPAADEHGDEPAAEPAETDEPGWSPDEVLLYKDIATMTPAELEQARKLVAELVRTLMNYRSRRFTPGKSGPQPDFRRILRRSAPYGEYAIRLLFRKRREKKIQLVLLCDVSGSMLAYSRFLIQFIYALRHVVPRVEVGVFATRMTMISDLLGGRDIHASLQRVEARADWGSGTDIGGSLREFNRHFSRRVLRTRTLLVILSDGWDRGDAKLMQEQIAWLSRRVHKLIWLNPLLGQEGYAPLCRGIRTALPYMDHFLPAHNLASLKQLSQTLRAELS